MHWNSTSLSGNVRGAEAARSILATARYGIGFDLLDLGLQQVLRSIVEGRRDLYETVPDEAAVTITDRPPADAGFVAGGRLLRVGAEQAGRNTLDSLEPGLILSAATLVAAGYALDRDRSQAEGQGDLPRLSQRERQVAVLLVDGASNKVIARSLDISVHTAKFHVTAILDKLGARNRADAVSIVLREGLVSI